MTRRRLGWLLLVTGLLAIFAAYLLLGGRVTGDLPSHLMIYGVGTTIAGPLLLAAPGRRKAGLLVLAASIVLLVVVVGFMMALSTPDDLASDHMILGLPRRAAIVLLGIGLLPALVLPWAYARAVSRDTLDPQSMAAFVAACRTARATEAVE